MHLIEIANVAWTGVLCGKILFASLAKEMLASLNKLTTYQEQNIGGVLPLKDEHGNAALDSREKRELLERVFAPEKK